MYRKHIARHRKAPKYRKARCNIEVASRFYSLYFGVYPDFDSRGKISPGVVEEGGSNHGLKINIEALKYAKTDECKALLYSSIKRNLLNMAKYNRSSIVREIGGITTYAIDIFLSFKAVLLSKNDSK